ncbi:MAG: DUF1553 domain-containing protein [Gemmataceae bacterium]
MARWIADAKNPLTARVIVNRVWQHHFGEGLVRSPDNFGRLGDRPTHAELLDWLATRFVESGWSVKALHRTIVLSSAYRMASAGDADSDNSLLTRFPRRRIEAEALRDGILAVSGQLDRTVGGDIAKVKGFEYVNGNQPALALPRRSVYLPVIRNDVYDLFQTFDFPEPSVPNGKRAATTVAPQALFLMNSPFVRDQAGHFAKRLLDGPSRDDAERVAEAYRRAFAREPRESEIAAALAYVIRRGWADYCHALFASNEFVTLD